jgi:hypothetical protein
MKRIKHNDLLPWFTRTTGTLPASLPKKLQRIFLKFKQQAPSSEPQASSSKQQTERKKC